MTSFLISFAINAAVGAIVYWFGYLRGLFVASQRMRRQTGMSVEDVEGVVLRCGGCGFQTKSWPDYEAAEPQMAAHLELEHPVKTGD